MARAACAVILFGAGIAFTQNTSMKNKDLGIFAEEGSVGQTPPGGKVIFDRARGEYRITGGGANVWGTADAFHFAWKKASGDLSLTADVTWVGTSTVGHRKAMLMVRQTLEPGSAYADAVSHGTACVSTRRVTSDAG